MIFSAIRQKADTIVLTTTAILIVAGLAVLSSASSNMSMRMFGEPYYFLKHQFLYGFSVGIVGFLAGLFIPVKHWKKFSFVLLALNIAALLLVFTPLGGDFGTANRWLDIGGIPVQPSEFLKITAILAFSAWFTQKGKDRRNNFKEGLGQFLPAAAVVSTILYFQPATSIIVIVVGALCVAYFVGKLNYLYVIGLLTLGGLAVASLFLFADGYRMERIMSFRNPEADVRGSGYHLSRALTTIGSGGLFGVGYGKSTLKLSLPEPANDSVFAIIAEEFGFVGSIFFLSLYLTLVVGGFLGSLEVKNEFAKLVAVGFASVFGIQSVVHIASISGSMPMTGVPLPFISYGGTSLIVGMTMIGLMVNIFRNA